MKNLFSLFLCTVLCVFQFAVFSQQTYSISGTVTDKAGHTLPGASVYVNPGQIGVVSDSEGSYVLSDLKKGVYEFTVSFLGYESFHKHISLSENITLNITLSSSNLSLQEVVVACHHDEKRKKEESLNIEIVNDDYMKQNLGGSLMNSLERLPGVTTIDIGSGQSKPVIRGLGFNRVVVVENNIKHEAQQWGSDHGLEIDQYAVENVEVIKGPASLMYGSDAIGGIIDMKNRNLPEENSLGGTVDFSGKSNNEFFGTSLSLHGRRKGFFATARATILDYGDYKVPTDSVDIYSYRAPLYENHLRNSAGKEHDFHSSFGIVRKRFESTIYLSSVNSKNGFFANAHGLEPRNVDATLHDESNRDILFPYQTVHHVKAISSSLIRWDKAKLEIDAGIQRNFREEWSQYVSHGYMPAVFPDSLAFNPDIERQFEKYVYSANAKLLYRVNDKNQMNFGVNSEYQDNHIDGRGFIIPAYTKLSVGGFVYTKHNFSEKSLVQAGIRYDYGSLHTTEYFDWFTSPVVENNDTVKQFLQRAEGTNRAFSNVSWSVGHNYNPGKWSYKVNIGKSFRMPIAKELSANGVNYHRFSYEVGSASLDPEISYQLDAGMEYSSAKFAIGTTPFLNYFSNYIYLNPTSKHNRLYGNGNQIYEYTQSKVLRYGTELHAHYEFHKHLQFGIIAEYVYSEQLSGEKQGFTLPFSPPASGIVNLKYKREKIGNIENAYVTADYRITAPQNNIVPPEETTEGYQLINLSLGGDIRLWKQTVSLTMQVQNLLNTKYFSHTSFYRLINVPEAGRNFIINISIPFSHRFNTN